MLVDRRKVDEINEYRRVEAEETSEIVKNCKAHCIRAHSSNRVAEITIDELIKSLMLRTC